MRRNALFWGVVIIILGVLFLLQNLGIIAVNIWSILIPVFLIALGIWILWGSLSRKNVKVEHVEVPNIGVARVNLRIKHGAGRLLIGANPAGDRVLTGDCTGGADIQTQQSGDTLDVRLSAIDRVIPFGWGPEYRIDWNLKLNPEVRYSLIIDSGASESRIDLSELIVDELKLTSGASSTNLVMPANAGQTNATFKTGAASLELRIPTGVAGRIRAAGGMASITIDRQRFPRMNDIYQSVDYDNAVNKVDIHVDTGVGSVDIR